MKRATGLIGLRMVQLVRAWALQLPAGAIDFKSRTC